MKRTGVRRSQRRIKVVSSRQDDIKAGRITLEANKALREAERQLGTARNLLLDAEKLTDIPALGNLAKEVAKAQRILNVNGPKVYMVAETLRKG